MKTTKKQLVFGAVLGIAAAALAVDRLGGFDRAADNAAAANLQLAPVTVRAQKADLTAKPSVDIARNVLAARLETVALAQQLDTAQVGDAFAADESWAPPVAVVEKSAAVAKSDGEAQAEASRREKFVHEHKLTAVMKTSRGGVAVVDGRMLRQGQALAGFELLTVTERAATFRRGDNQVELKLLQAGGTSPLAAADR